MNVLISFSCANAYGPFTDDRHSNFDDDLHTPELGWSWFAQVTVTDYSHPLRSGRRLIAVDCAGLYCTLGDIENVRQCFTVALDKARALAVSRTSPPFRLSTLEDSIRAIEREVMPREGFYPLPRVPFTPSGASELMPTLGIARFFDVS